MFDRKLTRDHRGRVITLQSRRSNFTVLTVKEYQGDTRRPLSVDLNGHRLLKRREDGTYSISEWNQPSTVQKIVTNVRLNQRTGRLTWEYRGQQESADIAPRVSNDAKAIEAIIVFAMFLFPPAWPLLMYMLIRWAARDACERLEQRVSKVLDWLYGAYKE